MRLRLPYRPQETARQEEPATEAGFILAQAALLLLPLLVFAAFATDIGAWYLEGQKAQR
ncbi:MAG: pilus assembly protein TadG-related protein, partial [Acidimicrobiales bacterium]